MANSAYIGVLFVELRRSRRSTIEHRAGIRHRRYDDMHYIVMEYFENNLRQLSTRKDHFRLKT